MIRRKGYLADERRNQYLQISVVHNLNPALPTGIIARPGDTPGARMLTLVLDIECFRCSKYRDTQFGSINFQIR